MEEDIRILEEICNRPIQDTEGTKIMKQAIKNLIKAYKNLEQIEQVHKETNGELRKRITELEEINAMVFNSKVGVDLSFDDYIQKTKIKDKITEIGKKYAEDDLDCETYSFMKGILQELLEE